MEHFVRDARGNADDAQLAAQAAGGDRHALELLVRRHQDYVYNLALRLFLDPDDAKDATQEVLIKVVTHLGQFAGRSQFRTWLYRIAVRHMLRMRRQHAEATYMARSSRIPLEVADPSPLPAVDEAELAETQVLCATGMLLCLDREQRLVLIVGDIFGAGHRLGAELFDTTPGNFRVRLTRARQDLQQFAAGRCGLVNPANPCRCPKKTRALVQHGIVDRKRLRFHDAQAQRIATVVRREVPAAARQVLHELADLFAESPFRAFGHLDELLASLDGPPQHVA